MLEKPIEPATITASKQAVLDKTVYVSSRREIVLNDTLNGLTEGRWSYNTNL
jgi:ariadne-1